MRYALFIYIRTRKILRRSNVLIFEGFQPQNVLILFLFSMKLHHLLILLGYFNTMLEECSSSRSRCSVKKGVLKNFTKFTGKFDIDGAQLSLL